MTIPVRYVASGCVRHEWRYSANLAHDCILARLHSPEYSMSPCLNSPLKHSETSMSICYSTMTVINKALAA
jgi:hypothetical protein